MLQLVVFAVCLSLVIFFCVLIFCHVRRNTLEENVGVKREIVKNLVYLLISNLLVFFALTASLIVVTAGDIEPIFTEADVDKIMLSNFLFPMLTILPKLIGHSCSHYCGVETSASSREASVQDMFLQEDRTSQHSRLIDC